LLGHQYFAIVYAVVENSSRLKTHHLLFLQSFLSRTRTDKH